jgi:branched-chain amino acid transport system permease protein
MTDAKQQTRPKRTLRLGKWVQPILGVIFGAFLLWRLYRILFVEQVYGPDTWVKFAISGLILGSVYAMIALGYTLVYGILFMINFAHGDVMMLGAYMGYFTLEAFKRAGMLDWNWAGPLGAGIASGLGASPEAATEAGAIASLVLVVLIAFVIGMVVSMLTAIGLERIAYRPLRNAPRLVPLISAIGASLFLENAAQLMFGATPRVYSNPTLIDRQAGWTLLVGGKWVSYPGITVWEGKPVLLTYTGVITFVMSIILMVILLILVQRTRMGKAMRAVAEDKETAALMGIDIDRVIGNTFAISGLLAGAAGVLWGLHMGRLDPTIGFIPGLKAFTAAVLGGIGNVAGAMLGGITLGIFEAVGPGFLGMPFQLKDVLAFSILVLVLIFRPRGILGEVLAEKKM